jgi:hypothetical protein
MKGLPCSFIVPALAGSPKGSPTRAPYCPERCRCGGRAISLKAARVHPVSQKSPSADRALARPPIGSVPIRGWAERGAARGHRAYQLCRGSRRGSARFVLRGEPFHGTGGRLGLGGLRCAALLGLPLLEPLASEFIEAPALHLGIEHFQGSAAQVKRLALAGLPWIECAERQH